MRTPRSIRAAAAPRLPSWSVNAWPAISRAPSSPTTTTAGRTGSSPHSAGPPASRSTFCSFRARKFRRRIWATSSFSGGSRRSRRDAGRRDPGTLPERGAGARAPLPPSARSRSRSAGPPVRGRRRDLQLKPLDEGEQPRSRGLAPPALHGGRRDRRARPGAAGTYPTQFDHPVGDIEELAGEIRRGRCRPLLKEITLAGANSLMTEIVIGTKGEDGQRPSSSCAGCATAATGPPLCAPRR